MSKRRHNFGTKRFKEKSLFIFHARIALKSLILLFVRLIARGARIGKTHTHTHTHTDRQTKYCNPLAHARRGLITKNTKQNRGRIVRALSAAPPTAVKNDRWSASFFGSYIWNAKRDKNRIKSLLPSRCTPVKFTPTARLPTF